MKKQIRTIDLFAGCGGLSLGFKQAGFTLVGAVDNWEPAVATYRKNFTDHEIFDLDLANVPKSVGALKEMKPDLIVGGPPCQDFSHAGKRDEDGGRAGLSVSYAKIIAGIKPKWFLMENVDQITKSGKLVEARAIFKKAGYGLTEKILDASFCGVPQKRKRFFMIGALNAKDGFALPIIEARMSEQSMTMREYFGNELGIEYYYRHPRNYNRRAVFSIDEPSPTIRGVNRPVAKGYPGHSLDYVKDLSKVRPLTTHERARVQTFPKKFVFEGSRTEVEQQIGNAVPVNLARFIAGVLKEFIQNGTPEAASATPINKRKIAVFA
ncbi:MAG: DNA cytosine methyltransferase [bacterium]|nr:DNA cytosine methyltransferase [bacterium]